MLTLNTRIPCVTSVTSIKTGPITKVTNLLVTTKPASVVAVLSICSVITGYKTISWIIHYCTNRNHFGWFLTNYHLTIVVLYLLLTYSTWFTKIPRFTSCQASSVYWVTVVLILTVATCLIAFKAKCSVATTWTSRNTQGMESISHCLNKLSNCISVVLDNHRREDWYVSCRQLQCALVNIDHITCMSLCICTCS